MASEKYPDFFCIGVQKAGTTWLYENLVTHKAFWLPFLKEVDFFNYRHFPNQRQWIKPFLMERCLKAIAWNLNKFEEGKQQDKINRLRYICGLGLNAFTPEWYARVFEKCPKTKICGDITPEYSLLGEEGIKDMLSFSPEAKFILMLRDPIERDFSHARMQLRDASEISVEGLLRALAHEEVKERSDYPNILKRWQAALPEGSLMVCFYDDILTRPAGLLCEIAAFLGVQTKEEDWRKAREIVHKGREAIMPDEIRVHLLSRHKVNIEILATLYPHPCASWQQKYYA